MPRDYVLQISKEGYNVEEELEPWQYALDTRYTHLKLKKDPPNFGTVSVSWSASETGMKSAFVTHNLNYYPLVLVYLETAYVVDPNTTVRLRVPYNSAQDFGSYVLGEYGITTTQIVMGGYQQCLLGCIDPPPAATLTFRYVIFIDDIQDTFE
jgi:hypothetical protein